MEQDQKRLADALEELKDHNFMKIHESAWKFMYYNLLRGLAIGLGSVVGATVLVTIFIQILAQFEFIPFIQNCSVSFLKEVGLNLQLFQKL